MFDQVLENLKKATETSVQVQQEMLTKWMSMWPGTPLSASLWGPTFPLQQLQQRWANTMSELLKRQREMIESSLKLGRENIERAFKLGEIKSPEEMRAKTMELWQKCLDSLRETSEMQLREFHSATEKWLNLMAKPMG